MFKKIKEYFELNKMYKNSKKILVINTAATITSVKNIVNMIEKYAATLDENSKEKLSSMTDLMSDMINEKAKEKQSVSESVK